MISYISENLPGIGGRMRTCPEDFDVAEIPAYDISGDGEHLFLEITKKQITTQAAISELAGILNCKSSDIGYAGMKDRQAVTTQRISVPAEIWPEELHRTENGKEEFSIPEGLTFTAKVLGRHNNKLKTGHLRGNRFKIRVRGAAENWKELTEPIRKAITERGFANFYGPQRFGRSGDNAQIGLKALHGEKLFGPKWRKWLIVSALQSELFNVWLSRRIKDGLFETALCGDVFGKLPQGGIFYSTEPQNEQPRLDAFEISPMGPIFGFKMFKAKEEALRREEEVLELYGIKTEDFRVLKAEGSRRRARIKAEDLHIETAEGDPVFCFTLPSGSYASVFMDEFMKNSAAAADEAEEIDTEN